MAGGRNVTDRTWWKQRYHLPMRMTAVDRTNTFQGRVQIFWGIGKPTTFDDKVMFAFGKCGKYLSSGSIPARRKVVWDN